MNKETYELIIADLTDKINECKKYFDNLKTTDDIMQLSIAEVNALKLFVKEHYVLQTQALMVDLYHILCMGNMSAAQEHVFVKLIKEYAAYRPMFNAFKEKFIDFTDIPTIPVKSTFRTLVIAKGAEFSVGDADAIEVEDVCTIEEYQSVASKRSKEIVNKYVDNLSGVDLSAFNFPKSDVLTIYESDIDKIKDVFAVFPGFRSYSSDALKRKIKAGSNYLGIKWKLSSGVVLGTAQTDTAKNNFLALYEKKTIDSVKDTSNNQ